jgi:UDP-GlcNAc:undecaprenyl-phosphate GlcNAc-1-phosphate transferase
MNQIYVMGAVAFALALILTPVVRDVFRSYQILDKPGVRKVHAYPIPRVGGIAIVLAYGATLIYFDNALPAPSALVWQILPGAAVIFLVGLVDDFFNLPALTKLMGEILGAGIVFALGLRVDTVAQIQLPTLVSLGATLFWLLLCTNALNLIDGLDGLCAGMGLLATLTLFGAAQLNNNVMLSSVTFPLVGALLGFLIFNFNPATVFLGDSGALTIGFLLGCYGMAWTEKTATMLSITVPLLALSIPLVDVSLAVVRRFISRRPIFGADRRHIHHRLLDRGLTPRQAVLVLYLAASLVALLAILLSTPQIGRFQGPVIALFCLLALLGIRQLRYTEFNLAGQMLFGGELMRSLDRKVRLESLRTSLDDAANDKEWWGVLLDFARGSGLVRVTWIKDQARLSEELRPGGDIWWSLRIVVDEAEEVILEGGEERLDAGQAASQIRACADRRKAREATPAS